MRKIVITFISATLAFSLASCGAGITASTRNITQVTDGAEAQIKQGGNNIKVRNLLLVLTADGTGVLVGTIVNNGPSVDALLSIVVNGIIATYTGSNSLPQNTPIRFEGETANAKAVIPALGVLAGREVSVTMFFANAGELTLKALVREQSDIYAGVTP